MEPLLQFAGRLHVMLLHAPIGLLIGLALLELFMLARRRVIPREVRSTLTWLVALTAAVSVGSGLLLREEGGHDPDTMDLHQWLGIASGVGALLAAIIQQFRKLRAYAWVLALTCGLIVPTGHFGATMVHGDDFLTEPFSPTKTPVTPPEGGTQSGTGGPMTVYSATIAPIFKNNCIGCHGPERQKGKLRLDTPEGIMAGGRSGPVVVAGDAAKSDLVWRLRLEVDDEDHMPPKIKPQPGEAEIKAIEQWITQGASFTTLAEATPKATEWAASVRVPNPGARNPEPGTRNLPAPSQASAVALASIRAMLVHVEPVSRDSALLVIDSSAVAKNIDDAAAKTLLEPVLEQTSDLTLARTKISDTTLSLIARMPRLRRLNISATAVTDAGVALLASHPALEELIVSNCGLTDHATASIEKMPSLRRVYVWKTGMTPAAVASLRAKRTGLVVDAGDTEPAVAIEKDEPIKPDTANAPTLAAVAEKAIAAVAAAKAEALRPVNTVCPVSGKPVDAGFAIVYKGRVIGFCCRHCLGQFLEEPEKFEASVK